MNLTDIDFLCYLVLMYPACLYIEWVCQYMKEIYFILLRFLCAQFLPCDNVTVEGFIDVERDILLCCLVTCVFSLYRMIMSETGFGT